MANAYLVQTKPLPEGKSATFAYARDLVLSARPQPGNLILFPEMFATGFSTRPESALAETLEPENSPTIRFLQGLADETKCGVLGGGIEEYRKENFRFRNWTGFFEPGLSKPVAVYRKRHPFADEGVLFSPGTSQKLFRWENFRVSPAICFDLRFPEDFRRARKKGANLLTVQAEWPKVREAHFYTLLRARAIENQCYVLAAARAGNAFANSLAFGPNGEEILRAPPEENVYRVSLTAESVKRARESFPLPEGLVVSS